MSDGAAGSTLSGVVVDDDPATRDVFARALRRNGIHVMEADSGHTALTLAQATTPQFVVTNIELPGVNGLELCRRLRAEPRLAALVILVVSGAPGTREDDALAAGCDAVLMKPCSPHLLLTTLRELLVRPS